MAHYRIEDLNGVDWYFGSDQALAIAEGTLKGLDGAEYSLDSVQGVDQRGVTVVGKEWKPNTVEFTAVVQPYQIGVYGDAAVELVSSWRDGLGEGETQRGNNELRFYVTESERFQVMRLVKREQMDWQRVRGGRMCKDPIALQSDESDWRKDPITSTFTAAQFAGASVANDGTVDSWVHFTLTGPITGATLGIAGEAVKLVDLTAGQVLEIETDPNWYEVTRDGVDVTFDLYGLADGGDDRWRNQAPARDSAIPVTITGTGTTAATRLDIVVPQIYRSAL